MKGVLLPIVTPFYRGELDLDSYSKLVAHYLEAGVNGFIPVATTGEAPTVDDHECQELVQATLDVAGPKAAIYVGVSANNTRKALHTIESLAEYPVRGYLVTSPYYNLPSQKGIYEHFASLARATDRELLIYNIPYRTGRNVENETILQMAKLPHIVGIKDSCGIVSQSLELLRLRPPGFSVLTGEDIFFYTNLVNGGDGGILASAHLNTERFLKVYRLVAKNDHQAALKEWLDFSGHIPLLFKEPNPAPIKYVLCRKGLIRSEEVRLPLYSISDELKARFDLLLSTGAI